MENTKVEVKINNMEYTIVSNETEEYVQRVALLVNKKIAEVKGQDSHLSTAMLAVMAAMNLADELLKSDMTVDNLRNEMSTYMDEAQRNGAELESKKLEVENLKEELHKLEIELAKRETELENLRSRPYSSASSAHSSASSAQDSYTKSASPYQNTPGERPMLNTASASVVRQAAVQNKAPQPDRVKYPQPSAMDKYRKK